jgi:phosphoadenosine phosphosulfate reductase
VSTPGPADPLDDVALQACNNRFAHAHPSEIITWATASFGPHLSLAASMNDAVLIDLAVAVDPAIEVVFIDTGYHFAETLAFVEVVRRRYGLNLRMMTVAPHDAELWRVDPANCCSAVKVGQLDRALAGKRAWMSGLRRVEAPSRASAAVIGRDLRGLVKINPLATWTDADVAAYVAAHDVPLHPLLADGYTSIGCAPCTQRPTDPDDPRSGRWAGTERTECGLHQTG